MLNILFNILVIVVVLNIVMFLLQPGMVFFPYSKLVETPANWGLEYEDVWLRTSDEIQLHGWYIPHQNAKLTLLFFHGNGGNISHRGDSIKIFHRLGVNVFIIDYRGYGRSEGNPSEDGLYKDAQSAWQYLISAKGLPQENILIFGRSLGGAVATKLAADTQPGALILESTFSSARDMAKLVLPGLSRLVFLRFNFDSAALINQVHCPLLAMHSPDDDVIPFKLGEKLFLVANQPKSFIQLEGNHNSGFLQNQPAYERNLKNFILTLSSGLTPNS